MPDSADFVLYWWHKAALLVRTAQAWRFGLITTNSLRQTFARRVVQMHLDGSARVPRVISRVLAGNRPQDNDNAGDTQAPESAQERSSARTPKIAREDECAPLSLAFAIPDHPWVDTAEGAAVRIAMTVGVAGSSEGELSEVTDEEEHEDGSANVTLLSKRGKIAGDLTVGADVSNTRDLTANEGLAYRGMQLIGSGFIVTPDEAKTLGLGSVAGLENHIRPYRNGRDLTDCPRGVFVIDLFGLTEAEVRERYPAVYQHVLTTVKPERDANNRDGYRRNWWIHGEPRKDLRPALAGLQSYIATVETAKHRIFQFLGTNVLPDNKLVVIAVDDPFYLGVLSSRIHVMWSLAQGAMLEDRPVYPKSECFDPFPFPLCSEAEKDRIRQLAEELDAHRKRVQAAHPGLTLTGMYNVLEKLRAGQALNDKDKIIHDQGLVSILHQLHDDLDEAVFAAYGWQHLWQARKESHQGIIHDLQTGDVRMLDATGDQLDAAIAKFDQQLEAEILQRLVTLNAQRAEEESRGIIHWLRPDYQNPAGKAATQETLDLPKTSGTKTKAQPAKKPGTKAPWPKPLAERIRATEQALHAAGRPVTAEDLTPHFSRAKASDLQEILESLVTLGRARKDGEKFAV